MDEVLGLALVLGRRLVGGAVSGARCPAAPILAGAAPRAAAVDAGASGCWCTPASSNSSAATSPATPPARCQLQAEPLIAPRLPHRGPSNARSRTPHALPTRWKRLLAGLGRSDEWLEPGDAGAECATFSSSEPAGAVGIRTIRCASQLARVAGLVMEATGLGLGDRCIVPDPGSPTSAQVEAEVVGFAGGRLFLMPGGGHPRPHPRARVGGAAQAAAPVAATPGTGPPALARTRPSTCRSAATSSAGSSAAPAPRSTG
ncbi:MAG: hypothetical protein IPF60_02095 [Betaproteobacteria bacterium]|nr:hypothetical protein [Betaproteobacteria bacterium]